MKLSTIFLSSLLMVSVCSASENNHGIYYAELQALKEAPSTKAFFNKDAHGGLVAIQRDIATYKALTPWQRIAQCVLLSLDVIVVTPDNLPSLYACVKSVCVKGKVEMPVVFITRQKGFLNAFALKLFTSFGGIVIGQDLLCKVSDEALEAIVAHEIGHIKHNHNNKLLLLKGALFVASIKMCNYIKPNFIQKVSFPKQYSDIELGRFMRELFFLDLKIEVVAFVSLVIGALIINQRFEKEADEFACKTIGKSAGLVEFFEYAVKKEQLREDEFVAMYDMIQQSRAELPDEYYELILRYYLLKAEHVIKQYTSTWGAHPSHQARIDAAKECLAQQA